ncbi:hypothetical protein AHF37_04264 [Paragonimus kellicotti]|nr:hypothetical protein AHF37_04264 [Paragonimus kellicotti]
MAKSFKNELRIKVILLTYEHLILSYRKESTVEDVFHEVCNALELEERDLFGLAIVSAENYLFLDPRERLKKVNFTYLSLLKAYKRNVRNSSEIQFNGNLFTWKRFRFYYSNN